MTHDMDLNSGDSTATGSDRNYGHSPLKSQLVGVTGTWDFPDDTAENHVTSLHPYPARFIPAIPRQAIQAALGAVSGTVWDPFAGSGTTLIEANQMGHVAVGVDVNHLAHFLQRVFTVRLTDDDVAFLMELEERVRSVHVFRPPDEIVADRKDIPHLTHWFSPGAIQAIDVYLHILQEQVHSTPSDLVARLSLSRVVVRVSRQQSDTQYRATKPDVTPERALATIASSLREVRTQLPRYLARQPAVPVISRLGDARDPHTYDDLPAPDLVVTSPPYPNSYEYWLYHKYRMFWLDMDPLWSRSKEIGARPFYSGTGKSGPDDFRRDMHAVLEQITRHAKSTTTQVWIMGDGVVKGRVVPTCQLVREEAIQLGWQVKVQLKRRVQRARSSFQGIGRLKDEDILVLGISP